MRWIYLAIIVLFAAAMPVFAPQNFFLHRRVVDRRLGQLPHRLLDQDEPPELAGEEVVHVAAAEVVQDSPPIDGVRSNGSWRMFTMTGMSVVTFAPGQPCGCW